MAPLTDEFIKTAVASGTIVVPRDGPGLSDQQRLLRGVMYGLPLSLLMWAAIAYGIWG